VIKDYAKKATIVPAVSTWRWPIIGLVTLALITALIVILLSANLKYNFAEPSIDQVQPMVNVENVEAAKPTPKPTVIEQPTQSAFTFPDILKQAEVKPPYVKVYESTAKDPTKKTSHRLQVASFKSESDAKALQKLLIKKQLTNVKVGKSTTQSGSVWFMVMAGPFQNRSMLNKAQDMLVQMNYSPLERKK